MDSHDKAKQIEELSLVITHWYPSIILVSKQLDPDGTLKSLIQTHYRNSINCKIRRIRRRADECDHTLDTRILIFLRKTLQHMLFILPDERYKQSWIIDDLIRRTNIVYQAATTEFDFNLNQHYLSKGLRLQLHGIELLFSYCCKTYQYMLDEIPNIALLVKDVICINPQVSHFIEKCIFVLEQFIALNRDSHQHGVDIFQIILSPYSYGEDIYNDSVQTFGSVFPGLSDDFSVRTDGIRKAGAKYDTDILYFIRLILLELRPDPDAEGSRLKQLLQVNQSLERMHSVCLQIIKTD